MSVSALEPRIRQILLSTPSTELSTITAKDVRSQLAERDPGISHSWIKQNKKEINALIGHVFEAVSSSLVVNGGQNGGEPPQKRKKEVDEDMGAFGGYEGAGDDDDMNGDEGGSETPPPKPKKSKSRRDLTDEEYARQLAAELNGSTRSSRSGKAPSGRTAKKNANRSPKKNKKSAERVDDSDVSDGDSGNEKKPKKKRSSTGGGGGAKGGFQKEFILRYVVPCPIVSRCNCRLRPVRISAPLSAVLEVDKLSRPQVVKQLWVYIKANDLQNPLNKREIICDDRLRPVFNADKIDMFKMNKVLGQCVSNIKLC